MCFDKGAVVGSVSCCVEDDDDDEEDVEEEDEEEEDAGGAAGAAEEDEEDEEDEDILIRRRAHTGRGAERSRREWVAFLSRATSWNARRSALAKR